jgi:ABC-type antimicrobial peptide transport system permease subunit
MSVDFAIKDINRKREVSYPFILVISLITALVVFLIHFTTSIGLSTFVTYDFKNPFYFSGGISIVFTDFTTLIIALMLILAFIIVIIITSTLITTKKRDIAIMKAVGSIPIRVYHFYLTEAYLVFLIGYVLGLIFGFISYGLFSLVMTLIGFPIYFYIDFIYLPILFFSCLLGIYFVPGVILRKIGTKGIIQSFSKDIPYDYDASKGLTFIPKWLSKIGYNFKISIINTIRRKGEFKRYIIVFSVICLILFTLTLGSFVLSNSSKEWVNKSQNEHIVIIGHQDVIENYALMYKMFSNPNIFITNDTIDFLEPQYLFNYSDIEAIGNFSEIEAMDHRLISFFHVEERDGYHCYEDGGCYLVGEDRRAIIPIIGVNTTNLIQDFEIEGEYIDIPYDDIFIGDGLAYNFFEFAFDQRIYIEEIDHQFRINGVIIDTFYSGFGGYVDLSFLQSQLNSTENKINILLIKIKNDSFNDIQPALESFILENLGADFSYLNLNIPFENNLNYINNIILYPGFIILIMAIISIFSLYNYQKGGIMDKAKDFLIMRAIGTKYKFIKRIMFFEAFYIIVPSLSLSLGIGMILNSLILLQRTYLPHISIPFIIIGIFFLIFLLFNYLSLFPILKKIKKFTIKDFDIY